MASASILALSHQVHLPIPSSAHPLPRRRCPSRPFSLPPFVDSKSFRSKRQLAAASALREWQDYDDAVKRKDLGRAIRFLISFREDEHEDDGELVIGRLENTSSLSSSMGSPLPRLGKAWHGELRRGGWERDWEVLDTCLNADDLKLVGSAYAFLQAKGFLPSFGKFRNIVLEGPREVTPTVLKSLSGLEASKLSPKKWGVSGSSRAVLVAFLGGISLLLYRGIDIRPNLAAVLGLALLDSIFLGGCCLAQISSYWPPLKRRILVHEAGHLLIAYLMGCPVRGVILDPIVAVQMGIKGQAGTQFWDEKLDAELAEGLLSGTAFDRYSMVLFAGIAAEALVYGEAQGGEIDENLFRNICLVLRPPLSVAQMANQARWAVVQSYNLLKWHRHAHRAVVKALEIGLSLSSVVKRIEAAMSSGT